MIGLLLYLGLVALAATVSVHCTKGKALSPEDKKQQKEKKKINDRWKALSKKLDSMTKDLRECPKSKNKDKPCNAEARIYGFVSFMRDRWMPIKRDELIQEGKYIDESHQLDVDVEDKANKFYFPLLEEVHKSCMHHSEDKEKLDLYFTLFKKHTDNLRRSTEKIRKLVPICGGLYNTFEDTYAHATTNPVPHPSKFWEQCLTKEEWLYGMEYLYKEGRKLLKERKGEAVTPSPVNESEKRWVAKRNTMTEPTTDGTKTKKTSTESQIKDGEKTTSAMSKGTLVEVLDPLRTVAIAPKEKEASTEKDKEPNKNTQNTLSKEASKEALKGSKEAATS